MNANLYLYLFLFAFSACHSQTEVESTTHVGGPCEGCEALLEYGQQVLNNTDTLPAFEKNTPKMRISGVVYHPDGKTPAENVILYLYHTNRQGIYETRGDEVGWGRRHGFIRGWVKTGADGKYTVYTFRPASYPDRAEPEHIHITVKEPQKNPYYIDEIVFDDDPLLTVEKRKHLSNRGGSGIVKPERKAEMMYIQRDIILGLHIPDYE